MISVINPDGKIYCLSIDGVNSINELKKIIFDVYGVDYRRSHFYYSQKLLSGNDAIPSDAIVQEQPIAVIPSDCDYAPYMQSDKSTLINERFNDFYVPVDTPEISLLAEPGFCHHSPTTNPDDILPCRFYDSSTTDSEIESPSFDSSDTDNCDYQNGSIIDHLNSLFRSTESDDEEDQFEATFS